MVIKYFTIGTRGHSCVAELVNAFVSYKMLRKKGTKLWSVDVALQQYCSNLATPMFCLCTEPHSQAPLLLLAVVAWKSEGLVHPKNGPEILFCPDWSYIARRLDMCIYHCNTNGPVYSYLKATGLYNYGCKAIDKWVLGGAEAPSNFGGIGI